MTSMAMESLKSCSGPAVRPVVAEPGMDAVYVPSPAAVVVPATATTVPSGWRTCSAKVAGTPVSTVLPPMSLSLAMSPSSGIASPGS